MEERATIARELHDSIAQSLSCMKMQVSCLQMQGEALPENCRDLLSQIRNELNTSRVQLRELLTTFRLQLTEPDCAQRWKPAARNTAPDLVLR